MTTSPKCSRSPCATNKILAALILLFTLATRAIAQDDAAQQLAAKLRSAAPEENSIIHGVIHLRIGDTRTNIPMVCKVVVTNGSWTSIYQTDFQRLFVIHTNDGPNRYLLSQSGGPTNVIPNPGDFYFADSDFSATDLGLDFLHWPNQKLLSGEMRLGQPCDVLESSTFNPSSALLALSRVRSYIDKQSGGILVAEGFDGGGHLVSVFSLHGSFFRKVNGQWRLEKMEMTGKQRHSQTIFQFDMSN